MKQSILKSFVPKIGANGIESFPCSHGGVLYKFMMEWENGDVGECNSKSTTPVWRVGAEYTYDIETNQWGNKFKNLSKVKDAPQDAQQTGQQQNTSQPQQQVKSSDEQRKINMQVAYEVSTNIIVKSAETLPPEYTELLLKQIVENTATEFCNWIMEMPQEAPMRCNALRRALDQMDIPQFNINSKAKVLDKAKEINEFYRRA